MKRRSAREHKAKRHHGLQKLGHRISHARAPKKGSVYKHRHAAISDKLKLKRRQKPILHKISALLLTVLLLVYVIFFSNVIKRDCGMDTRCFGQLAAKCTGAKLEEMKNSNIYKYTIKGAIGKDCIVDIKLKKMSLGTPVDIVNKLEGKNAECKIPRELLKANSIDDIENLMVYCSGPLKEGIYEVMLDDMYALVIKNIKNITKTVEEDISKLSAQAL